MVSIQERVLNKSGLGWRAYGMHVLEISIFSQHNVITRPTKIINTLLKDRKILTFYVIFQH